MPSTKVSPSLWTMASFDDNALKQLFEQTRLEQEPIFARMMMQEPIESKSLTVTRRAAWEIGNIRRSVYSEIWFECTFEKDWASYQDFEMRYATLNTDLYDPEFARAALLQYRNDHSEFQSTGWHDRYGDGWLTLGMKRECREDRFA